MSTRTPEGATGPGLLYNLEKRLAEAWCRYSSVALSIAQSPTALQSMSVFIGTQSSLSSSIPKETTSFEKPPTSASSAPASLRRSSISYSTTPLPLHPTKPNNLAKHLIPFRQMHHRPLLAPKIRKLKANFLTTMTILNRNLMDLANVVEQQVPACCFPLFILRSGGQVWA